jgi:hypothetical protein
MLGELQQQLIVVQRRERERGKNKGRREIERG